MHSFRILSHLIAASFASAPLFEKKTFRASRRPQRVCGLAQPEAGYSRDSVWINSSLPFQGLDQRGCVPEWKQQYLLRSPNILPSSSQTREPGANKNDIVPAVVGHNELVEKLSSI